MQLAECEHAHLPTMQRERSRWEDILVLHAHERKRLSTSARCEKEQGDSPRRQVEESMHLYLQDQEGFGQINPKHKPETNSDVKIADQTYIQSTHQRQT